MAAPAEFSELRSLGERGCRRCGSSMHRSGACWRWDHWASHREALLPGREVKP